MRWGGRSPLLLRGRWTGDEVAGTHEGSYPDLKFILDVKANILDPFALLQVFSITHGFGRCKEACKGPNIELCTFLLFLFFILTWPFLFLFRKSYRMFVIGCDTVQQKRVFSDSLLLSLPAQELREVFLLVNWVYIWRGSENKSIYNLHF